MTYGAFGVARRFFFGRPPFAPLALAASAFASVETLPPDFPRQAGQNMTSGVPCVGQAGTVIAVHDVAQMLGRSQSSPAAAFRGHRTDRIGSSRQGAGTLDHRSA